MAVQLIAQLAGLIVNPVGGDPADVENDTTAAGEGTLNVYVPSAAGTFGYFTAEPIAKAILATLTDREACNVIVTQGAGALGPGAYGTLVAQINANIANLSDPADVETDTTAAGQGVVNVQIPPQAGTAGFLALEPIAKAVLAACANGPCTVFVTTGNGSSTLNPTQ